MTRVHVVGCGRIRGSRSDSFARLRIRTFELGVLESRSHAGDVAARSLSVAAHDSIALRCPRAACSTALRAGDIVIAAGAHGEAHALVPKFVDARRARRRSFVRTIVLTEAAAYGLPEWNRDAIASAAIVANPGCYPTARCSRCCRWRRPRRAVHIVIDAKSGITGAGRKPRVGSLFAEVSGDIRAYGFDGHRHQPEIERELARAGIAAPVVVYAARRSARARHAGRRVRDLRATARWRRGAGRLCASVREAPFVRIARRRARSERCRRSSARTTPNCASTFADTSCGRCARSTISARARRDKPCKTSTSCCGFPEETGLHARAVVAMTNPLVALRGGLGAVPGVRWPACTPASNRASAISRSIVFDEPQVCASVDHHERDQSRAGARERRAPRARRRRCGRWCATRAAPMRVPGERGDRDARATARQARALLEIRADAGHRCIDRRHRRAAADGPRASKDSNARSSSSKRR